MKIAYKQGKKVTKVSNKLTKKEKKEIIKILEPFYKLVKKLK
jgi:hypothetical protein